MGVRASISRADLAHGLERHFAEPAHVDREAVRAEHDAVDRRRHERAGRLGLVVGSVRRGDRVEAGRRLHAAVREPVPVEAHETLLARAELEVAHDLAPRIAYLDAET